MIVVTEWWSPVVGSTKPVSSVCASPHLFVIAKPSGSGLPSSFACTKAAYSAKVADGGMVTS